VKVPPLNFARIVPEDFFDPSNLVDTTVL
jgi:hypothetical protein